MSLRMLIVFAIAGILGSCVLGLQRPAPRYSLQSMPETSFTCRNKIVSSYYADPETDCQCFHVCVSVSGVLQDFKFLCPNLTAFDQESQTCADWEDVDCEAATLYYASDNFDLYRIGSGLESLHYDSIRSDAEPQDHLQRSESNDPIRSAVNSLNRVAPSNNYNSVSGSNKGESLRGSSSSNFYNSQNNGKDEDYENEKYYQETTQEPKRKTGVRKVARKQHSNNNNNLNNLSAGNNYPSSTTTTTTTTVAPPPANNYNNYNGNYYNSRRTTFEPTTTVQTTQDFSRNNQNNQKFNTPTTTFRPPSTAQPTYSNYQASSTTARPAIFTNNNNYNANQQGSNNYNGNQVNNFAQSASTTVKPVSFSQNFQHAPTTSKPTSYNQNYQGNFNNQNSYNQNNQFNQNSRTQPTTQAPTTNYQQADYTNYQSRNYNNIQRSTNPPSPFPTTTLPTTAAFDHYNNDNNQYTGKTNAVTPRQIAAQTTKFYPNNFSGNNYSPTTYTPVAKKGGNNDVNSRGVDRYNADNSDDGQYYGDKSSQAKPTQFYDSTKAPKKASQYNNYENTNAGKFFESSTTNYDLARAQTGIGFSPSSINLLAETPKTTTPVPRRNGSPTTYNPNSFNGNNQRGPFQQQQQQQQPSTTQKSTTRHNGSARPFSTTVKHVDATTPKPKSTKKNDYDYAYYDNAGALEYDSLDLEHVAGGKESSKIARN